jgi:hypothetical protein
MDWDDGDDEADKPTEEDIARFKELAPAVEIERAASPEEKETEKVPNPVKKTARKPKTKPPVEEAEDSEEDEVATILSLKKGKGREIPSGTSSEVEESRHAKIAGALQLTFTVCKD